MKSKISFFNTSLLRKDLLRFIPAWVLYGAFLILIYSGTILGLDRSYVAESLGNSIQAFSIFNLAYGMLCAQLLFGDLHNSRMCNALHALPIRRESWFLTHIIAGMLFCLIPVAASGIIFLAVLGKFWVAALLWMAALTLQFLFYFAVGTLSMILTGNRFAAVVVYTIINFMAAIALWLFHALYVPHMYGMVVDVDPWLVLCPVVEFIRHDWFMVNGVGTAAELYIQDGWLYLGICAVIGLLIQVGALLLYRKRHLETAGDFIAFRPLAPVFLVLFTFSAGAAMHLFSELFVGESTEFIFLLVGLAIGFFIGLMLLKRTLKVFRIRALVQFGVIIAVFGLTLLLTIFDPFGVTRWVPDAEDVKYVTLDRTYSSDEAEYGMTDKALIEQVISVHQHGIDNRSEGYNGVSDTTVTISYHLKSGQTVIRQYYIDTGTVAAATLEYLYSQPINIFGATYPTADEFIKDVTSIVLFDESGEERKITDREDIRRLLEALYKDAQAGNLCQQYPFYSDYGQSISLDIIGSRVTSGHGYYIPSWYVHFNRTAGNAYAVYEDLIS